MLHCAKFTLYGAAMKKVFLGLALSCGLIACQPQGQKKPVVQAQLKPVIKTITGDQIDFNHLKRPWVIVNYWANWCAPCKQEIPELNKFAASHDNVYLIGVNYDGVDSRQLLELIAKNDIHYFNALTDPSQSLGVGDIPGLPVTFVFNEKGKLHKKLFGPQTAESLSKALH